MTLSFDYLLGTVLLHAHPDLQDKTIQVGRDAILATSPTIVRFAIATDTKEVFFADGQAWYLLPFKFYLQPADPDMGIHQDSSRIGYGERYVYGKEFANCWFSGNTDEREGAVKYEDNVPYVYSNSAWRAVVVGLTLREGSDGQLQMQPTGKVDWYDVFTGSSLKLGLNNLPLTQQHNTHMGAYPAPQIVDGGNAEMNNPDENRQLLNRTIHRILPRRMTNAERLALSQYEVYQGEHVYETDTDDEFVSDGAGNWKQIT